MTRQYPDLTNLQFGRLLVTKFLGSRKKSRWWLCKCSCGKEVELPTWYLHNGTQSCGCLGIERRREGVQHKKLCKTKLKSGEAQFNVLFYHYSVNASKSKREFSLSKDEFRVLVTGNCEYCGVEPYCVNKGKGSNGIFIYNGVDRIDNNLGYEVNNCVSCCKICNHAKHTIPVEEFKEYLYRVARKYKIYV
jgi:hypothetical protein